MTPPARRVAGFDDRSSGPPLPCLAMVWAVLLLTPPVAGAEEPPPPLPEERLRAHAPEPQWTIGWQLGVCGVGQTRLWAGTDFCGAVLSEVLFLRSNEGSWGLGPYAQAGTSGFFDFRGSAGATLHAPVGDLFAWSIRGGPLFVTDHVGVSPGGEAFAEFGFRSLNWTGHYALTHGLVLGVQHAVGDNPRSGTTLWLNLRLDGFWLAAPFGLLR